MYVALSRAGAIVTAVELDDDAEVLSRLSFTDVDLVDWVRGRERDHPRWVWADTSRWYPELLAAGVRVERSVDLRLCHRILRGSASTASTEFASSPPDAWDQPASERGAALSDALFDLEPLPIDDDPFEEWMRQRAAVNASTQPGKLGLLLAAESVGALVAEEMRFAGLPWSVERHDELLTGLLGARPAVGRPAKMEAALARVRDALDQQELNPDSPVELMRGLQRAGIPATSLVGAEAIETPGHRAAARVQEAGQAVLGERLALARGVGARWALPPSLRAGRCGHRALGVGRRGSPAAAETGAGCGRRR